MAVIAAGLALAIFRYVDDVLRRKKSKKEEQTQESQKSSSENSDAESARKAY